MVDKINLSLRPPDRAGPLRGPFDPVRDSPSGNLGTARCRGGAKCVGGLAGGGRAIRRDRLLFGPRRRLAIAGAGACAARLRQGSAGFRQSVSRARPRFREECDRRRRRRRRPGRTAIARRPAGARLQLGLLQDLADGGASRRRPGRYPARERRRRGAGRGRAPGPGRGVRAGRRRRRLPARARSIRGPRSTTPA